MKGGPSTKSIHRPNMSSKASADQMEKSVWDPMGLYSKNSPERKEGTIKGLEDNGISSVEVRNIRDPMGLYPKDAPEREAGMITTTEYSSTTEGNVVRDPLGLYPKNAPEREAGLIQPLETMSVEDRSVKDPLNIYNNKSEVDTKLEMSGSLPFLSRPRMLDGSLPGDRGFDPLNFSSDERSLEWYRRAEIKHARIAMLAAVGWPISEILDKKLAYVFDLKPLLGVEDRVPSVLNGGLSQTSPLFWVFAAVITSGIEILDILKYNNAKEQSIEYIPGDLGFDPLNLYGMAAEEKKYRQEGEIFNGRLSMLAITGFAIQEWWTNNSVINETPFFFKPIFLA